MGDVLKELEGYARELPGGISKNCILECVGELEAEWLLLRTTEWDEG